MPLFWSLRALGYANSTYIIQLTFGVILSVCLFFYFPFHHFTSIHFTELANIARLVLMCVLWSFEGAS